MSSASNSALVSVNRSNGVTNTVTLDGARGWVNTISNQHGAIELSSWTYGHSPAGRVASTATSGRYNSYSHEGAGRLSQTVETTTPTVRRKYVYDADSNRTSLGADNRPPRRACAG